MADTIDTNAILYLREMREENAPYHIQLGLDPVYEFPLQDLLDCDIPKDLTYSERIEFALNKFDEILSDPNLPIWKKFDIWENQTIVRLAAETAYFIEHPEDIAHSMKCKCFTMKQHRSKARIFSNSEGIARYCLESNDEFNK